MTQIEIGVKYTPAHPDWAHVISDLREGDEVEAWYANDTAFRGALAAKSPWFTVKARLLYIADHNAVITPNAYEALNPLTELTVTKLAPRKPDWWGPKVIRDADSEFLIRTADGRYLDSYGSTYTDEETDEPEIRTVIDANGNLTWDAVEDEFTERIYKGIRDGLASARTLVISEIPGHMMASIRAACRGDHK